MRTRDYIVIWLAWCTRQAVNGKNVDEVFDLLVEVVNGDVLDVFDAIAVVPNRNDDKFSKVEKGGGADEFRYGSKRWWEVAHDTRNSGVGKGLDFLEMRDGANSLRGGFSDCEVRADFGQCGEFMYMRGS